MMPRAREAGGGGARHTAVWRWDSAACAAGCAAGETWAWGRGSLAGAREQARVVLLSRAPRARVLVVVVRAARAAQCRRPVLCMCSTRACVVSIAFAREVRQKCMTIGLKFAKFENRRLISRKKSVGPESSPGSRPKTTVICYHGGFSPTRSQQKRLEQLAMCVRPQSQPPVALPQPSCSPFPTHVPMCRAPPINERSLLAGSWNNICESEVELIAPTRCHGTSSEALAGMRLSHRSARGYSARHIAGSWYAARSPRRCVTVRVAGLHARVLQSATRRR